MWRASGESSFNTSPKATDTATTTTPKPPASKPASSPKALAVCWLPVTSPSALRSTSTTVLSPWTPVTPTEDSSSIPTNSPAPAPATYPNKPPPLPQPKTVQRTNTTPTYPFTPASFQTCALTRDLHLLQKSLIHKLRLLYYVNPKPLTPNAFHCIPFEEKTTPPTPHPPFPTFAAEKCQPFPDLGLPFTGDTNL